MARNRLRRLLTQLPLPAFKCVRPNPQVRRDLTDADAGRVENEKSRQGKFVT